MHGRGRGRSKKEAEQEAAEAASARAVDPPRPEPPVPELPEVEVVRRGLEQWVAGRTVAAVEVHHPRAIRRHLAGADDFAARR